MVFVEDCLLSDRRYAVFIAAYPEVHGMLGGIFAKELPGFANGTGKDFFAWRRRVYHRFSVRDVSVYQVDDCCNIGVSGYLAGCDIGQLVLHDCCGVRIGKALVDRIDERAANRRRD